MVVVMCAWPDRVGEHEVVVAGEVLAPGESVERRAWVRHIALGLPPAADQRTAVGCSGVSLTEPCQSRNDGCGR